MRHRIVVGQLVQCFCPLPNPVLENVIGLSQRKVGVPFAAQRRSELSALDSMKRFLEEKDTIGRRNLRPEIFRLRTQLAGHDHNVDVAVDLADALGGFDSVNARRHPDIEKDNRKRVAGFDSIANGLDRCFTLVA